MEIKKPKDISSSSSSPDQQNQDDISNISYSDLANFQKLGEGNFGRIDKADYLGTDVAVKECFTKLEAVPDFDFKKYISREVEVLRGARHPNIVQFMGLCVNKDKYCIVTEFVSGGNLRDWIERESQKSKQSPSFNPLRSLRQRISFAIDIARAMAYLHAHSIIHRDMKLENLLLTENDRIKVCDFGFSRLLPASPASARERSLSYCGSDDYMSPELILCMDYTNTVDIFSYGIILLSLLILTPPTTAVFRRVVPGFGLDMETVRQAIETGSHVTNKQAIFDLVKQCLIEDGIKRIPWKDTLVILKEEEARIIQKIKEMDEAAFKTAGNVGLPTSSLNGSEEGLNGSSSNSNTLSLSRRISDIFARRHTADITAGMAAVNEATMYKIFSGDGKHEESIESTPHRFSIISAISIRNAVKCQECSKPIQGLMVSYLVCDDCGLTCHKKCSTRVRPLCGMRLAISRTVSTALGKSVESLPSNHTA